MSAPTDPAASPAGSAEETELLRGYRAMVIGRRFDQQATSLAKQGYLAVYPSSLGQECLPGRRGAGAVRDGRAVRRVTGFDVPYPPPRLEHFYLPTAGRILDAVAATLGDS